MRTIDATKLTREELTKAIWDFFDEMRPIWRAGIEARRKTQTNQEPVSH